MTEREPSPRYPDPLIDEIRAIRGSISARFDNDIGRLFEYLREVEAEYQSEMPTVSAPERADPRRYTPSGGL